MIFARSENLPFRLDYYTESNLEKNH
jgi:hypothetical protein